MLSVLLNCSSKNVRNFGRVRRVILKKVGIIGGGCYGTALAECFSKVSEEVVVVEKNSQIVESVNQNHENLISLPGIILANNITYASDDDHLYDAQIIFLAVPTKFVKKACEYVKNPAVPVVLCSKGFDLENKRLLSDLAEDHLSNEVFVLSGPSFAAEISRNLPAKVNLAGKDFKKSIELSENLSSKNFKIEPIEDMIGLQIAGSLKNVLAIGCGVLHGKNLGHSAVVRFMVEGIQEMTKIAESFGGCAKTFTKIGALGDVILTCSSLQSRNMSFGKFLADGGTLQTWSGALVEGVFAAKFIPDLRCSTKIFIKIYQVIHGLIRVEEFVESVFE